MDDAAKADRFVTLFRDMCLARNRELDLPQLLAYWAVLKDVDEQHVKAAARHLQKMSDYFPSAAAWYQAAASRAAESAADTRAVRPSSGYECGRCRDTGFELTFSDEGDVKCASFCACRATNTVLRRARAEQKRLKGVSA